MPQARSWVCLSSAGTLHFLWVTKADQRKKEIQHPDDDISSTSTGPKKKKSQRSEEGKQAICRCYTVNTVWFNMNFK